MSALTFIIVCPLVGLAGFVDAIAGGGGFISLPAYLIAGIPPINAVATNKVSSAMGTTLATVRYAKLGYINMRCTAPAVALALAGSWLGARAALLLSDGALRIVMLVLLPLMAVYVLKSRRLFPPKDGAYNGGYLAAHRRVRRLLRPGDRHAAYAAAYGRCALHASARGRHYQGY